MKSKQLGYPLKQLLVLIAFMQLLVLNGAAQKRVNVWYFGSNAGIDFNSGTPVALTNGMINTFEGVASICDTSGSILFYTDGLSVWNRNHTVMSNGTGLLGSSSSSQSAIIIPQPANDSLYYLFTVRDGGGGGLNYSKIDMNLNGGFGDVMTTVKNIPLITPTTEKLTAVVAQNGIDIWVLVHEWLTNNFYAYLVTPAGINPPVITAVGLVHNTSPNQIGCMKTSHNGHQLAVAITYMSSAELFDFDNATGVVSNPVTFTGIEDPYGVEFSPNNSKLYFSSRGPYTTKAIYQYDLNAGSPAAIIASKTYVYQSAVTANNGSIQLAPDKKIYIAQDNYGYLEVINDPDLPAASCGYVMNGFNLSPKSSQQGLPNYITTYFFSVSVINTCFGDSTYFDITANGIVAAEWNFDDTLSGLDNISYIFNPVHVFSTPGTFNVQLIQYYSNGSSDTTITVVTINATPQINLGVDTTFCTGTTFLLDAGSGYPNYLWQDGSTNSVFTASASGTYYVTVTNANCVATDSISLVEVPCQPIISFTASDTSFCEKHCIDFFDLSTNNPTSWQWFFPGADSTTSALQNPTNICYNNYGSFDVTLIACNALGCDTLVMPGYINEYQTPIPLITQSNDTLYSSPGVSYQWWNVNTGVITGATNSWYLPTTGGDYYCIVTDTIGCAGVSNTIAVSFAGVNDLSVTSGQLSVVPNPFNSTLSVSINSQKQNIKQVVIEIKNLLGQTVFMKEENDISSHFSKTFDLSSLEKGIYFLEVIIDTCQPDRQGERMVKKIMKQ